MGFREKKPAPEKKQKKPAPEKRAAPKVEAFQPPAPKAAPAKKAPPAPAKKAPARVTLFTNQRGLWGDKVFALGEECLIDDSGCCEMTPEAADRMLKCPGWSHPTPALVARSADIKAAKEKRQQAALAAETARKEAIRAEQRAKAAEALVTRVGKE